MSTDPTQLAVDYSIEVNNTGNAAVKKEQEYVDPRGEYLKTAQLGTADTAGSGDRFSITNEGVDLRIAAVFLNFSQGSEDGRADWTIGWDASGKYATESILTQVAVGATSGSYSRNSKEIFYPKDIRPLFEHQRTLQMNCLASTAGSGDSTKPGLNFLFVPDDDSRL